MMHGRGQSDGPVVPKKAPNVGGRSSVEEPEGRGPAKGNAHQPTTSRAQDRTQDVPEGLERVRRAARKDEELQFTTLLHHVSEDRLRQSLRRLKKHAAAGVDGVTWSDYAADEENNLRSLHDRLHRGAYRARPSRRSHIPKANGGTRPLGIASLEDKIAQGAVAEVLNAIYEEDFFGFSYGFRPGRRPHDALDALATVIDRKKVSWVLDADIRGYFDAIDHDRLMQFIERRIADPRILRLIRKWLTAGVLEDGELRRPVRGTPQGATISPLLANVYLHYVLDVWIHERRKHADGEVYVVRYADDFVICFQYHSDAVRVHRELEARLAEHGLTLHPEKTRLIEFGREAARNRRDRGQGKPETFDFLGFTHICGRTRKGRFQLQRRTQRARLQATVQRLTEALRRRMPWRIARQGQWLARVIDGWQRYYAVPTNSRSLWQFRRRVMRIWLRLLRRRGNRRPITWARLDRHAKRWLPRVEILHPWPSARFDARTQGRSPVR